MANFTSAHTGNEIDLAIASGSTTTGIIKDFNTLSGSLASTINVGGGISSSNGSLHIAPNTDKLIQLGRATFGPWTSDYMYLSHHDMGSNVNYALNQTNVGVTSLNAASGRSIQFKIANSEKMTLASDGNVGIGTASPVEKLHIDGNIRATGDVIANRYVVSSSVTHLTQSFSSGSTIFGDTPADDTHRFTGSLDISGSGTDLTVNGKVGIGTTSPAGVLQVTSDGSNKFFGVFSASTGAGAYKFYQDSNNHMQLYGYNSSGTANVVINTNGVSYLKGGNVLIGGSSNNAVDKLQVAGSTFISSHITASGNISASSNLIVNGITASSDVYSDDVYVASEIIHTDDPNTKIAFDPDKVTFTIGGLDMITLTEDSTDTIALGAAISTPITASGNISASGDILTSENLITLGNISGSITSTGSFGAGFFDNKVGIGTTNPTKKLVVGGDISSSGKIFNKTSYIELRTSGNDFRLQHEGGGDIIMFSGRSLLYQGTGNVTKVKFSQDGDVTTSGNIFVSGSGGTNGHITASGNISASGNVITNTGSFNEINIPADNQFIKVGASGDLQLYHNGSNSFIDDAGTGELRLRGNARVRLQGMNESNMVSATQGAGVSLYHNNVEKFVTTAGGINVAGQITASGNISSSLTSTISAGTGSFQNDLSVSGKITTIGQISASAGIQAGTVSITATDDGSGNGTIPNGTSFAIVNADSDANHIVILPKPTVGNIVHLSENGTTGYELRSSAPASIAINSGTSTNGESAIAGAITYVKCVCVSATSWICSQYDADGDESKVEVAAD